METKYRPVLPEETKQKGDEFNIGKWNHEKEDRWIKSTMTNGFRFAPWEEYYRRPIKNG